MDWRSVNALIFPSLLIRERLREETRRENEWNEEEERKSEKSGKGKNNYSTGMLFFSFSASFFLILTLRIPFLYDAFALSGITGSSNLTSL